MLISTSSPSCQQGSPFPTSQFLCLLSRHNLSMYPRLALNQQSSYLSHQGPVHASPYLSRTSRRKCRSFHRTIFLKLNLRNLAPGPYVLGFGQSLRDIIKYSYHNHTSPYIRCKHFSLGTALKQSIFKHLKHTVIVWAAVMLLKSTEPGSADL